MKRLKPKPEPDSLAEMAARLKAMGLKPRHVSEMVNRIRRYGSAVLKRYCIIH